MTHNCTYLTCTVLPCETITTVKVTNIFITSVIVSSYPFISLSPQILIVFYQYRLVVVFCRLSYKWDHTVYFLFWSGFFYSTWWLYWGSYLACIVIHSFLLWNNVSVCGTHHGFIHSPVDWILALTNKAAVSICVYTCFRFGSLISRVNGFIVSKFKKYNLKKSLPEWLYTQVPLWAVYLVWDLVIQSLVCGFGVMIISKLMSVSCFILQPVESKYAFCVDP